MSKQILTVFGDENFPSLGAGTLPKKRQQASDNLLTFFKSLSPELVYLVPTKGTCIYAATLCSFLKIPYILISPHPGFFDTLPGPEKASLARVLNSAKSVIILNEKKMVQEEAWDEAVEFLSSVSEVVAFMYSKETSKDYQTFLNKYNEKYFTKKILLELVYDNGEVFSE